MQSTSRKILAFLVAGFAGLGSQASLADYSSYAGFGPGGDYQVEDYSGGYVGVALGTSPDYAGYADAGSGRQGGWVRAVRPGNAGESVYVESMSEVNLLRRVVAAQGSGLSEGDPVTLALQVRMDGNIDWSTLQTPQGNVAGSFDVYMYMNINRNPDVPSGDCEMGFCLKPDNGMGEWLAGFSAEVYKDFTVDANQNIDFYENYGYWAFYDSFENETTGDLGDPTSLTDVIDTGDLSFTFDANVGDVIMLESFFDLSAALRADGNGTPWFAMEGDFLNTASFALVPVTGGVSVAPVPIPAAVWLFGSGLLGLLGVARRGK